MSDRIVCACGCGGDMCMVGEEIESMAWNKYGVVAGAVCHRCHQPVRAYNLDRLLRIEAAALELDAAVSDGNANAWIKFRALRDATNG